MLIGPALAGPEIWRLWRNTSRAWDRPGAWWGYSERAWLTFVRLLPTSIVFFGWLIGGYLWIAFDRGGPMSPVERTLLLLTAAMPFLYIAIALLMYFFDQPKILMPPHLRARSARSQGSPEA